MFGHICSLFPLVVDKFIVSLDVRHICSLFLLVLDIVAHCFPWCWAYLLIVLLVLGIFAHCFPWFWTYLLIVVPLVVDIFAHCFPWCWAYLLIVVPLVVNIFAHCFPWCWAYLLIVLLVLGIFAHCFAWFWTYLQMFLLVLDIFANFCSGFGHICSLIVCSLKSKQKQQMAAGPKREPKVQPWASGDMNSHPRIPWLNFDPPSGRVRGEAFVDTKPRFTGLSTAATPSKAGVGGLALGRSGARVAGAQQPGNHRGRVPGVQHESLFFFFLVFL